MTELLAKPYRELSPARVNEIHGWYSTSPQLRWIAPNLDTADVAAQFRARHGLRTPDALQAATAARYGATGLVANDKVFRRVSAFETLLFDEIL
jgi:predicted nucleic acid-binding protein